MSPIFIMEAVNIWAPILIVMAIVGGVAWGSYLFKKDNGVK
jgi:hypothetical protein